jgi:hypothetical protein
MAAFSESYDVLVVGGGVAGVAASVAAARAGLKAALVEKTVQLGGLATSGLINWYTPLCDGRGSQVTYGLSEEMLLLSIRYGPGDVSPAWRTPPAGREGPRYAVAFSPAAFVLALDELLVGAGVELWLDTLACVPVMEGDRVAGLEVETKGGRGLLRGRCIVDATGDADVAFRSGAPCAEADNWLSLWALEASLEDARKAVAAGTGKPLLHRVYIGATDSGQGHPPGFRKFGGTDAREITEFVLTGRKLLRQYYADKQGGAGGPGRNDVFPVTLPSIPDLRTTRRIVGQTTVTEAMVGKSVDDSVGLVADWNRAGRVWEMPYGALVPQKVEGLLVAGRCISSEGKAWEVTRVIHASAHTGQIAGIAAALAVRLDTSPRALDVEDIRSELRRLGIAFRLQ